MLISFFPYCIFTEKERKKNSRHGTKWTVVQLQHRIHEYLAKYMEKHRFGAAMNQEKPHHLFFKILYLNWENRTFFFRFLPFLFSALPFIRLPKSTWESPIKTKLCEKHQVDLVRRSYEKTSAPIFLLFAFFHCIFTEENRRTTSNQLNTTGYLAKKTWTTQHNPWFIVYFLNY